MLTPEQKAIRETGIGASEISAVVEVHPRRGPIDVWLAKPTGSRAAVTFDEGDDSPEASVGNDLEAALLDMHAKRSGIEFARAPLTLRHATSPRVLASPDGLAKREDLGAEVKVVGARMSHHWDQGPPDYVIAQCAQSMAVTCRSAWDIVALVGGTDFRVYRIERDLELEGRLIAAAERFWADYIETDLPPDPRDPEERRRYLAARYPSAQTALCRDVGDGADGEIAELVRWLREAKAAKERIEAAELQLESALCELIGPDYGIKGPWGKLLWYPRAGAVSWKSVAEDLAGGAVSVDMIERHRGPGGRTVALYEPPKKHRRI